MATHVYTKAEMANRARLLVKGAKRSAGDTSDIERRIERIDKAAKERGEREAKAHRRQLEQAKDDVAAARVAERAAPRQERQAAREARRAAEKRLRLVERSAR